MEVKIIKANTPTELSSKRKIERLRVAAYCRVSTDDEDQTKSYQSMICLLYTSPSPRDMRRPRMPSSA